MARSAGLLRVVAALVMTGLLFSFVLLFSFLADSRAQAESSCLSDAPCVLPCNGNRSTIVVIGPSTTVEKRCAGGSVDACTTNATTPNKVCIFDGVVDKSGAMTCMVTAGAGKGECANSMSTTTTPAASTFILALLGLVGLLLGVRHARRRAPRAVMYS